MEEYLQRNQQNQTTQFDGASEAEDFQPQTTNPQAAGGQLQSGANAQDSVSQDVLNFGDARIIVPAGSSAQNTQNSMQDQAVGGGINWLLVVAIAAVIVFAVEFFVRRRENRKTAESGTGPVNNDEDKLIEASPIPEPRQNFVKTPVSDASTKVKPKTKTKPKKSKSKRKKSRK